MAEDAMKHTFRELEERQNALKEALVTGAAKDYAEYRQMCGEIRGLSFAHTHFSDLVRKLQDDE